MLGPIFPIWKRFSGSELLTSTSSKSSKNFLSNFSLLRPQVSRSRGLVMSIAELRNIVHFVSDCSMRIQALRIWTNLKESGT